MIFSIETNRETGLCDLYRNKSAVAEVCESQDALDTCIELIEEAGRDCYIYITDKPMHELIQCDKVTPNMLHAIENNNDNFIHVESNKEDLEAQVESLEEEIEALQDKTIVDESSFVHLPDIKSQYVETLFQDMISDFAKEHSLGLCSITYYREA